MTADSPSASEEAIADAAFDAESDSAHLADFSSEYRMAVTLTHGIRESVDFSDPARVRHWFLPVGEVSGDFFCCAENPRLGWCALLGDAAGHGLASAIFAMHMPMLFRESVMQGLSLPAIHARLNRFLLDQHISDHYVCGALLRIHGREIEVINAGMPDVLLFSATGALFETFSSQHLPFGIIPETADPPPQRYRLAREDHAHLMMLSDGITELALPSGQPINRQYLLDRARLNIDQLFAQLKADVEAVRTQMHDDASLVMIALPLADALYEDLPPAVHVNQPVSLGCQIDAALRIVENYDRGMILADSRQQILYVNPKFTAITGYSLEDVVGATPRLLNSGRHGADFYRAMWQALATQGRWEGEIWNRRKDGTQYLEWLNMHRIDDANGQVAHYIATFTVIEQQALQEKRVHFLALHDSLTGLANRVLLTDRGESAIHRADRSERAMAVLFIDLDRFKSINDSLGHDIGDEVLVAVSQRLTGGLRADDTLSRFGGDEFVCLLPDIADRHDAGMVANKLLAALDKPIDIAGHKFKISASIGVSAFPSDGRTLDDLIVAADRAMMQAKQAGGNLVKFFSAAMAVAVERQLELEAQLDAAIRSGHLELYYQPKFNLETRTIIGAEALVRWRDPVRGLISPAEFIPIAERSDLIAKIGNWVLLQACSMLVANETELPAQFHLAVNVSPLQLERCDLPGEIMRALETSGIAPDRLQIEVTESMFIRDAAAAGDALRQIAHMGVAVALDDFGTGYSNLGALTRLPLDSFKLDQSFVRDVDQNDANASIARSVWHLADGLGKKVVAEGIETCAECMKVMAMGYRIGQGYRFGKPMPENAFMEFLKNCSPDSFPCPRDASPVKFM